MTKKTENTKILIYKILLNLKTLENIDEESESISLLIFSSFGKDFGGLSGLLIDDSLYNVSSSLFKDL